MTDSKPVSARFRKPLTGRSNISEPVQFQAKASNSIINDASSSVQISSVGTSVKARWNDTVRVSRALSPRDPFLKPAKVHPPILSQSVYPTVPPYEDETGRRRRPLSCPQKWLTESQKPHILEKSAMTSQLDNDEKQKYCREFIERNRSRLWQFDTSYAKKTPRSLCNELTQDYNFFAIMTQHHRREKVLDLSSSDNTRELLKSQGDVTVRHNDDPHLLSLTTTRSARERKINTLIQPMLHPDAQHRRGYEHAPEYGNFSRYNSVIKTNQAAVLKR